MTMDLILLKKIHTFLLDLLFPVRCLGCGKHGEWLCAKCFATLPRNAEHRCPVCEKRPTPWGQLCFECIGRKPLDGLLAVSSYQHALVSKLVHHYKYRFLPDLHVPLGKLLLESFAASELPLPQLIIPVPLHPRRERWRGFNQAGLLAHYLSENLAPGFSLPLANDVLKRQRYTKPQMEIKSRRQRQLNLAQAFAVLDAQRIQGASILLVDDIATTGSTLFECAQALKAAGAKKVFALVIARQTRLD